MVSSILKIIEDNYDNLNESELYSIKVFAEGLLNKKRRFKSLTETDQPDNLPIEGNTYEIGDERNGRFKVKVLKNRRTKALVRIIEKISNGTRRKSGDWDEGSQIIVPFTYFN